MDREEVSDWKNSLLLTSASIHQLNRKLPRGYAFRPQHVETHPEPEVIPGKRRRKPLQPSTAAKKARADTPRPRTSKSSRKRRNTVSTPLAAHIPPVAVASPISTASPLEVLRTQIAEQEKRALELQLETLKAQVAELQAQRDKVSKPKKRIRKRKAAVKYEDDDSDAYVPSRPRPPPSQPTRKRRARQRASEPVEVESDVSSSLKKCLKVINNLMAHPYSLPFNQPVDPDRDQAPGYFDVVQYPMDFGTVKKNIQVGNYDTATEFKKDVELVFYNARLYNLENSIIAHKASYLEKEFNKQYKKLVLGKKPPSEPSTPKARPRSRPRQQRRSRSGASSDPAMTKQINELKDTMLGMFEAIKKQSRTDAPTKKPRSKSRHKPMTKEEKRQLSSNIHSLDASHLGRVVQIIHDNMPQLPAEGSTPDEIEIDIDALDAKTLRELEKYVKQCLNSAKKKKQRKKQTPETNQAIEDVKREIEEINRNALKQSLNSQRTFEDEDIVIDDEPAKHYPPVAIEKDNLGAEMSSSTSESSDTESESEDEVERVRKIPVPVDPGLASRSPAVMSALQTTTPTEQPGAIGGGPFSLDVPDGPGLAEAAEMEVHSSCASADILLDTSREDPKEVVIQNAADWMSLEEESSHPKNNSVDSEPLWSEYQKKEELQKQKEKEREEKELQLKKDREERERLMVLEIQRKKKEEEEAEAQRKKEEEERQKEEQRQREAARLAAKLEREKRASELSDAGSVLSSMASFERGLQGSSVSVSALDVLKLKQASEGNGSEKLPEDSSESTVTQEGDK